MLLDPAIGALNGIALGSEIGAIRDFGPADAASIRGEMVWLEYASRGLSMTYVNGKLVTIDVFFDSLLGGMHPTKFVPCRELTIRRDDGAIFRLKGDSPPDALEAMFGPPFEIEDDDYTVCTEKVYSHRVGDQSIGAAYDATSNRLVHLEICPMPIGIPDDAEEPPNLDP